MIWTSSHQRQIACFAYCSMATTIPDFTSLPEKCLSRQPSPADVEDGYYQPIPSRRWYHLILDSLTPMALRLRSQHYPHHPFVSHRLHPSTSTEQKQDYIVTEVAISELGSEDPIDRRLRILAVIKLACIIVPVTILCLL